MERPVRSETQPSRSTAEPEQYPASPSRRKFMGKMGGVAAAAATVGAIGLSPILDSPGTRAEAAAGIADSINSRVAKCLALRIAAANKDAKVPVPPHTTNGDEQRYADKSGTYTKCLLQDGYGRVNLDAYSGMKTA